MLTTTSIEAVTASYEDIFARVTAWANDTSDTSASNSSSALARQLVASDERASTMLQALLSRMDEATLLQASANESAERLRPGLFDHAEYEYNLAVVLRRSRLAMQQSESVLRRRYPPGLTDIMNAPDRRRLYHSLNNNDRATVDSILELLDTRDQRIEQAVSILTQVDAELRNFEEYVATLG